MPPVSVPGFQEERQVLPTAEQVSMPVSLNGTQLQVSATQAD